MIPAMDKFIDSTASTNVICALCSGNLPGPLLHKFTACAAASALRFHRCLHAHRALLCFDGFRYAIVSGTELVESWLEHDNQRP